MTDGRGGLGQARVSGRECPVLGQPWSKARPTPCVADVKLAVFRVGGLLVGGTANLNRYGVNVFSNLPHGMLTAPDAFVFG